MLTGKTYLKAQLALIATTILFGTVFVAIRFASVEYSPGALSLLRFFVASLGLGVVYYFYPNKKRFSGRDWLHIIGIALMSITFYSLALNQGEHTVGAAMSSFIISQTPLLVTLGAIFLYKERVNHWGKLGFLVSFIGLVLILWGTQQSYSINSNVLLILLALLLNSAYLLLQKPLLKKFHALELTTFYVWIGTVPLFIFTPQLLHTLHTASFVATSSVIYMGLFPTTLGYFFWNYGFTHLPAARASATIYLIPFFALIFGWIFLAELPALIALIGAVVAIAGAYVISKNSYHS